MKTLPLGANMEKNAAGPMERPASRKLIDRFRADGIISDEAHREALADFRAQRPWGIWIDRMSLLLGAALFLAGIVFFFAFNWAKIVPAFKFAIVETLLLACLVAAWIIGFERLAGKICLMAGSILVGVFLAVFGQIYQTGADAYQLFAAWSFLIVGWVLVSRFPGLWMTWVALLNTTLILYCYQTNSLRFDDRFTLPFVLLSVFNSAALMGREYLRQRGLGWIKPTWPRHLLLASILIYLLIPVLAFVTGGYGHEDNLLAVILAVILFVLVEVGAYCYFRFRDQDLAALALGLLAVTIVVLTFCGHLLLENSRDAGIYLLMALLVAAGFGLLTVVLLNIRKSFAREEHE